MDPVLFLGITNKNTSPLRLCWHRHINAFFDLKTDINQRVNLGMISARHTTNRKSFKKVTCPFDDNELYLD